MGISTNVLARTHKIATQPIFVPIARPSKRQDRNGNGAFRYSIKQPRHFRCACGAIFHNLLKQQKIAPGLDAKGARDTMGNRLCRNRKKVFFRFSTASRRYT